MFQVLNLTREQYALDEYTVVVDAASGFVVGGGVIIGAESTAADWFVLNMDKACLIFCIYPTKWQYNMTSLAYDVTQFCRSFRYNLR